MGDNLDINTPLGQQSLVDEREAVEIFRSNHPARHFFETPKKEAGDIDGVICNALQVTAVVETKCRYDMTLEKFHGQYSDEWLITFDKIIRGMMIAKAMHVEFIGFMYIVQSKALLAKRVWSPVTGLDFDELKIRKTKTRATINGGIAERDNAFLNMDGVTPMYLKVRP